MNRVSSLIFLIEVVVFTYAFNVDFKHAVLYGESPQSFFGYTVALTKSNGKFVLLVGAPMANSTYDSVYQPGVVYVCPVQPTFRCQEINLNYQQGNEIVERNYDYTELRSDSWLGVALDVSPDDSQFVACGHLWKDQKYSEDYLTNGICYVSSTNLGLRTIRRLLPLVQRNKQVIDRRYIYALGVAGMSVHYATDRSTLLVGAPGVFQMSGTVVGVPGYENFTTSSSRSRPVYYIPIPNEGRSDDSYFGYSVASGKFFADKKVYYLSGAPRQGIYGRVDARSGAQTPKFVSSQDGVLCSLQKPPYLLNPTKFLQEVSSGDLGVRQWNSLPADGNILVYIFLFNDENPDSELNIISVIDGTQMGEYFGAALCVVDLNNDGHSDVIVGAPLYSVLEEEGRIYVFMSDGTHLQPTRDVVTGSSIFKARFGTSIASFGDLDLDGFDDIAVGAPYEGNGAVYIYHGSSRGLLMQAVQKILASEINPSLKGFGISLSKGKDIDDNFYPDIAVGAAVSGNSVILRSKPVAQIKGTLSFDTNHINTDYKNCTINGNPVTCFDMNVCILYEGKHIADQLVLQVLIDMDTLKKKEFQMPRVHYLDHGQIRNLLNFSVPLLKLKTNCTSFSIHVQEHIVDFLTPIWFEMSYKINEDHASLEFCKTCPVVGTLTNITKQLAFFTGCGEDDRCVSDVHLGAGISKYEAGASMIIGAENTLQLLVDVSNDKDPAFQTNLLILFPPNVDYSRVPSQCSPVTEYSALALSCSLGNPLESGHVVSLNISVDVRKVSTATKKLIFNLSLSTTSEEDESNLKDNVAILVLPLRSVANISVNSWQMLEQQFVFNRSDPGVVPITHMYQVVRIEPSPIRLITIEVQFPISTIDRITFLRFFSVEVFYDNVQVPANLCASEVRNLSSVTTVKHAETEHGTATIVDCGNMMCHIVKCKVGPFVKRETARVNVTAVVDLPVLIEIVGNADIIQLRSSTIVKISDDNLGDASPISTEVSTTFLPQDLVPPPAQIAVWIIILAIIGGILLLAVIIFVFYKLGFFQRKEHERLLDETAKENTEASNHVDSDEQETLHPRADSPEA